MNTSVLPPGWVTVKVKRPSTQVVEVLVPEKASSTVSPTRFTVASVTQLPEMSMVMSPVVTMGEEVGVDRVSTAGATVSKIQVRVVDEELSPVAFSTCETNKV